MDAQLRLTPRGEHRSHCEEAMVYTFAPCALQAHTSCVCSHAQGRQVLHMRCTVHPVGQCMTNIRLGTSRCLACRSEHLCHRAFDHSACAAECSLQRLGSAAGLCHATALCVQPEQAEHHGAMSTSALIPAVTTMADIVRATKAVQRHAQDARDQLAVFQSVSLSRTSEAPSRRYR